MKRSELKTNSIYVGDSCDVLKSFPSECVDLIVTSPPYFGCRVYGNETIGREESPHDYIENLFKVFKVMKKVLKPEGSLYLNIGDVFFGTKGFSRNSGTWVRKTDSHYKEHKISKEDGKYLQHKQLLMLPSRLAIKMQNDGWILRGNLIWEKPNPLPSHSPDRRLPVYENIFHFVKSKKYFFDYDKAKELSNHRDVIKCGIEAFGFHHASFPEKLIEPLILTTSRENDVVFDPFFGSGTVGLVAMKHKRKFIGIEINTEFSEKSKQRIESHFNQASIFDDKRDAISIDIIDGTVLKRKGRKIQTNSLANIPLEIKC